MSFRVPPWFFRKAVAPAIRREAERPVDPSPPSPIPEAIHVPRQLSLATATREYARKIEAGTFDHLRDRDVAPLAEGMGPALWSWQRARRLTRQLPWRAGSNTQERHERARALREMRLDLPTWEKALDAIDKLADQASHYDMPPPEPLTLPDEIRTLIEERRRAVVERATRRRGAGKGVGRPPPDELADDANPPPDPTETTASGGPTTDEQDDDERHEGAPPRHADHDARPWSGGTVKPIEERSRPAAKRGLHVRFVTRMSGHLNDAVATAARKEGLTAGAWVRRVILERVDLHSPVDARSGRPVRRPEEEVVVIASAIRALGEVAAAFDGSDPAAVRTDLGRVRDLLVPLVLQRAER